MYAWRNKAGTEVDRATDRATTRTFLAHAAGSFSFEKAYDQGLFDLDISAIALGEDACAGRQRMLEDAPEVL